MPAVLDVAARALLFVSSGLLISWILMGAMQSSRSSKEAAAAEAAPAQSGSRGGGTAAAKTAGGPEKTGAGLLLLCGDEVLLLQRTSKHNFGTWGLPGGNADDTDSSLLETATREAREEMGEVLPPFEVAAELLTKRGKRQQKHYTVFVGRLTPEARAAWQPKLNEEHSAWRWFKVGELQAANAGVQLHPVVELALLTQPHQAAVAAAVSSGAQVP